MPEKNKKIKRNQEILVIDKRFIKTNYCLKCGSKENLTHHHVIPKTHKKNQNTETDKVTFCRKCHDNIECYILAVESFLGGVALGKRYKLSYRSYYVALVNFLGPEKCADVLRKIIISSDKK